MAHSMFLKGPGFDHRGWLDDLRAAIIENPRENGVRLSSLCQQVVDFDEDLDRPELWLHPLDGVRGVMIRQADGDATLSLPVGASAADFDLAWELMRMGVKRGATADDGVSGRPGLSEAQIRAATDQLMDFNWTVLVESMKSDGSVLPIAGFLQTTLDPRDAEGGAKAFEKSLVARVDRYAGAFVANVMEVRVGGLIHTLSNYCHLPSLIDAKVDLITLWGEGGRIDETPIPAAHFYSVLGDRVERLGDHNYIPAIDFGAEPELVAALRTIPLAHLMPKATSGRTDALTDEDWSILAKAPCLIFLLVASADGHIDRKETALFRSVLHHRSGIPSPIFARIIRFTKDNFPALFEEIKRSQATAVPQLLEISALLHSGKIPRDEAALIAKCLYKLGTAVAAASRGFLGVGPRICKKEAEMLRFLKNALHVPGRYLN